MGNGNDRIKRHMHTWAFRESQELLAYKAVEYGIRVEPVPPAFSLQTYSKCGHQSRRNRDSEGWFTYNECGCSVDGDYNAAKYIGLRLLPVPEGNASRGWATVSSP